MVGMHVFIRSTLIGLSLCVLSSAFTSQARGEEFYIYRDSSGVLVVSNQEPPDGSTIIKQMTFPEQTADRSSTSQPQAEVRPQAAAPKAEEEQSNVPADDLAPRTNWVWAWSI